MTQATPLVRIWRTPVVKRLGRGAAARILIVETPSFVLPGIENADDPDKMPSGAYDLVMATMATASMRGLWLPGTQLFGHPANWPHQLKGCWAIGRARDGHGVLASRQAFQDLFADLGGFVEGERVPVQVIEL